jgi:TRAP-type C4-dicarboxylate transport system permease small subunit
MNILETLSRFCKRAADVLYVLAAWLFMVVVIATAYEVVARYFFARPTIWANELTVLTCAAAFMIAGPYVMRTDEHLSITLLYDFSPPWLKRVLATIKYLVILWMCIALAVFCFESGWEPLVKWELAGTQWNPPLPAIIKPLIVLVAAVMALQATVNYVRQLRPMSS